MRKVVLFSALLIAGLIASQLLLPPSSGHGAGVHTAVRLLTTLCLGFIMIHVGLEFEVDKSRLRELGWDYFVAATAAAFPWVFSTLYFVFALHDRAEWGSLKMWEQMLLAGRFAAPTSAGILFSMLAAAGLAGTWLFQKARVLAIFDDLDTVLLMVPLQMMLIGLRWELGLVVLVMAALLWVGWRFLHQIKWPTTWPFVLGYALALVALTEGLYVWTGWLPGVMAIHVEILLPAFVLGCVLVQPHGAHSHDKEEGKEIAPPDASEQRASTIVSSVFMVLVGLSMPPIAGSLGGMSWGTLALHVLVVTLLGNLGKMFPVFCYRKDATLRERLALAIGMWPRGEVGAGVLVVSLGYGIAGAPIAVATLCLALNLVLTGAFIAWVKVLLAAPKAA
ncbi:MAG: sodium:proton antiporter [Deltaproteobacteria bacterium]|nr:sodium:proton antiporter [Deltaproteobacteria bacterium]